MARTFGHGEPLPCCLIVKISAMASSEKKMTRKQYAIRESELGASSRDLLTRQMTRLTAKDLLTIFSCGSCPIRYA